MVQVAKAIYRQGKVGKILWKADIHDDGDAIIYDKNGMYLSKEKYRNAVHAVSAMKEEGWNIIFTEPAPFR